MEIEKITIKIERRNGGFMAVIYWNDGTTKSATGQNYPELYKNIIDTMQIKLNDDEENDNL